MTEPTNRLEINRPFRYVACVFLAMMGILTIGALAGVLDDIGSDAITFFSLGACIAAAQCRRSIPAGWEKP